MQERTTLPWRTHGFAVVVLTLVAAVATAGAGAAVATDDVASNAELTRGDSSPGATTNHTFSYDLDNATENGTEFDVIVIDYSNPTTDLSRVTASGISMRDDTGHSWDGSDVRSVSVSDGGTRLRIVMTQNASFSLNDQERVFVSYEPVKNAVVHGEHSATMTLINNDQPVETGTVRYSIEPSDGTSTTTPPTTASTSDGTTTAITETTVDDPAATTTDDDPAVTTTVPADLATTTVDDPAATTDEHTPSDDPAGGGDSDSTPGFGVGLAALSVVVALVLAVRQRD